MKKSKGQPGTTLDEWRTRIRATGLRSTAARLAVLQKLETSPSPLSHAELADLLESQGFDRATVYRNLTDLAEVGMVSRTELGDHVWRFELRNGEHGNDHPHFVCVDCGAVTCLSDVDVKVSPSPGGKRSIIGQLTEVLLKGRCQACV